MSGSSRLWGASACRPERLRSLLVTLQSRAQPAALSTVTPAAGPSQGCAALWVWQLLTLWPDALFHHCSMASPRRFFSPDRCNPLRECGFVSGVGSRPHSSPPVGTDGSTVHSSPVSLQPMLPLPSCPPRGSTLPPSLVACMSPAGLTLPYCCTTEAICRADHPKQPQRLTAGP